MSINLSKYSNDLQTAYAKVRDPNVTDITWLGDFSLG